MRAGALGFLHQDQACECIVTALTQVAHDTVYLSEAMNQRLLQRVVGGGTTSHTLDLPVDSLSDRELQVFQFIGEGLDMRKIAEKLHLSPKTVETYRGRIKTKLGLSCSSELVWRAVKWFGEKHLN
jgi:DNA-binding NarL/FixJ family response regulator